MGLNCLLGFNQRAIFILNSDLALEHSILIPVIVFNVDRKF